MLCTYSFYLNLINIYKFHTMFLFHSRRYILSHSRTLPISILRGYCSKQSTVPFLLTDIGEGISEVEIVRFHVKKGDAVKQFQPLVDVQSDKATVEISSRYDGVIHSLGYQPGDMAAVGSALCHIKTEEIGDEQVQILDNESEVIEQTDVSNEKEVMTEEEISKIGIMATPGTRAFAKRNRVDIHQITGSGPHGRVIKEDVIKFMEQNSSDTPQDGMDESKQTITQSDMIESVSLIHKEEPIRGLQRGMFKSMTASLQVPQMGLYDDINMEQIVILKKRIQDLIMKSSTEPIKFTYLPIFVKVTSMALKQFPILNARINSEKETIEYFDEHNISIAMSTEHGLIVPTIKNVENLSMVEIGEQVDRLSKLAKEGRLMKNDLEHGTFTISSIGPLGGKMASPIVFPPQVCIGAIGKIEYRPIVNVDGMDINICRMMSVSWSADHRIVDGATLAKFNQTWKNLLENPNDMLLDMK